MDVSALDRGLPAELGHRVTGIARARGSVVVPVIEKKIEEVLKSSSPATCFSDPTVDPRRFVGLATGLIESAEDENALKAASMLMRIDEARFGPMVQMVFLNADGCRNPFIVAYRGLDRRPGDQSTGHRLGRAAIVGQDRLHAPTRAAGLGEATLDRYGLVVNDALWEKDPIASRLKPELSAAIRGDIVRLATETLEKQTKH